MIQQVEELELRYGKVVDREDAVEILVPQNDPQEP